MVKWIETAISLLTDLMVLVGTIVTLKKLHYEIQKIISKKKKRF